MTHELKTWPAYFKYVKSGSKPFELRKDDRNYKVGDRLILKEYDALEEQYSGDFVIVTVSYILRNASPFGLQEGFVILGLKY